MQTQTLSWFQAITSILFSWPAIVLAITLIFRAPILVILNRLTAGGKVGVGPVTVELNKLAQEGREAIQELNRLNIIMAKTRLLEMEILKGFGPFLGDSQSEAIIQQVVALEASIADAETAMKRDGKYIED